ncbi:hypothetical protein PVAND_006310 [Polypedilum vanderplanki]|uniref:Aquaporin n=1 Tax=Polypedilum vanderplanki TaxID=319348 RepID=A0A9J6C390_POLVA|nr:hypothetical protein PVAND_006310 [Polypedilum vanderplanki]
MILNQDKIKNWLVLFFAELLGTGILVFIGCLSCVDQFEHFHPTHLTICLAFGLSVMIAINCFGCVSGAHINPVVTLTAIIYKLVDIPTAIIYVIGQMIGALLGYWLVRLSIIDELISDPKGFCVSHPGLDVGRSFVVEFMITFMLIFVVCGVWDPRNKNHHDSAPLRFGLAVAILAFIGGPFGGGSMNPARSFAPAIYNWNWDYHWIYWVAPTSASLVASFIFRYGFHKDPEKTNSLVDNEVKSKEDA